MKKYYLFQKRGLTDSYFCGNVYINYPNGRIQFDGVMLTFSECVKMELCKEFDSETECNNYFISEKNSMDDDNEYAKQAMKKEQYNW